VKKAASDEELRRFTATRLALFHKDHQGRRYITRRRRGEVRGAGPYRR